MRNVFLAGMLAAMSMTAMAQDNIKHTYVAPQPAGVDVNNIKDATLPVQFNVKDIDFKSGKMTMTVFSEDLYDMVDIHLLATGDTIHYDSRDIIVKKKEQKNDMLYINDCLEEGGANLQAFEGGTYRGMQMDDHPTYTKLGTCVLPISKNVVITDCGENPTDKYKVVKKSQQQYLQRLKDYKQEFSCLSTTVTVENGVITAIKRVWIP